VAIAEGVTQSVDALWGGALFSVSQQGTLLFVRGASERRAVSVPTWYDRKGNVLGTFGEPRSYNSLRISHDGKKLVTSIGDPGDIWTHDLVRGTSTRFTFDPGNDIVPIWSPDDETILFQSNRVVEGQFAQGSVFRKPASGRLEEQMVPRKEGAKAALTPDYWSRDGDTVLVSAMSPGTGVDIMKLSLANGTLEPIIVTDEDEQFPTLSPDEKWMAYESSESGASEIYVQAYPDAGGKWQVSADGGTRPVWSADGSELFYQHDDTLMSVEVEAGAAFRSGEPEPVFELDTIGALYGHFPLTVAPDGERFLVLTPVKKDEREEASVTLVQGWRALLE
jgi:Tol biopolymer transport system component